MTVTDIEQRIIAIWTDVLGEEEIAPDDDFFDLGGSSIAAVRILPRLCQEFGVEAEIGLVFDHPTPGELAEAVARITG